jgi:hypothetical protein
MNHLLLLFSLLTIFLLPIRAVRAQTTATTNGGAGVVSGVIAESVGTPRGSVTTTINPPYKYGSVSGAPYSVENTFERTQTLADGTHITEERTTSHEYRDSQGRVRMETNVLLGFGFNHVESPDDPKWIQIIDPVEGVSYVLDEQQRIAHRFQLLDPPSLKKQAQPQSNPPAGTESSVRITSMSNSSQGPPRPEKSHESLGTQVQEGVTIVGTRTTETYPVGMVGNDRAFSVICERWVAPELHLQVLSTCSDPRTGDTTTRANNLSTSEPDPSLFRVPAGYSIVDETGAVKMTFTRP